MILKSANGNAGVPAPRTPARNTESPAVAGSGSPLPGSGNGDFAAAMAQAAQAPAPVPPTNAPRAAAHAAPPKAAPENKPAHGATDVAPAQPDATQGGQALRTRKAATAAGAAQPQPIAPGTAGTTPGKLAAAPARESTIAARKDASATPGKSRGHDAADHPEPVATTPANPIAIDASNAVAIAGTLLAAQAAARPAVAVPDSTGALAGIRGGSRPSETTAAGNARVDVTRRIAGDASAGTTPGGAVDLPAGAAPTAPDASTRATRAVAGGADVPTGAQTLAGGADTGKDLPATDAHLPAGAVTVNDTRVATAGAATPAPGSVAPAMHPASAGAKDRSLDSYAAGDKNTRFADLPSGVAGGAGPAGAGATASPENAGSGILGLTARPANAATDAAANAVTAPALAVAALAAASNATTAHALAPSVMHVATPVGDPGFGQDVSRQLISLTKTGAQSAELTLNPEHLGPVSVTIQMNGMEASLSITAAHEATRTALREALPQLDLLFAQGGLQLGGAHVGDGSERHAGGQTQPGDRNGAFAAVGRETAPVTAAMATTAGRLPGTARLVDTFA